MADRQLRHALAEPAHGGLERQHQLGREVAADRQRDAVDDDELDRMQRNLGPDVVEAVDERVSHQR